MNLQLVRRCVCDSLTVDGKEEINLTDTERQEAMNKIADWLKQNLDELNYLLQWFIVQYGEYTSIDEPCECCGDYIETYNSEI